MYKPLLPPFLLRFLMRNGSFMRNKKRNSKGGNEEKNKYHARYD